MSGMFKLNFKDFARGVITAVGAALLMTLYNIFNQEGFDVLSVDWGIVGNQAMNAAVAAFMGYLFKNGLSDTDGKFLGSV